jgi:Ser/Thr protein kinase RdoA (MazF antagonist)
MTPIPRETLHVFREIRRCGQGNATLHVLNAFDNEAVRTALRNWPQVGPIRHIAAVEETAFSGAGVFRVTTDCASYALRRWPPGQMPEARLRELHRFLAFLHAEGISEVAVPLAGDSGTLIESEKELWQLEPWKPGVADFVSGPSDERLGNAMRLLARLHTVAARYEPTPAGREWFYVATAPSPAVQDRSRLIAGWDSNRLRMLLNKSWRVEDILRWFEWASPTVRRELESVRATPFRLHACLRDIWSEHVLYSDQVVTGVIDASAARTENAASDLSRLLGSLLPDSFERWELALNAYAAVRPLTEGERRLVRILDRSGVLLSSLHWAEQIATDGPLARRPRAFLRHAQMFQRLEQLVGQIGSL